MKILTYISIAVAIFLPVSLFGFELFGYGGCPLPILSILFGSVLIFTTMLLYISSKLLFVINLIAVVFFWRKYKFRSFIPLGILILGMFVQNQISGVGIKIGKNRFKKYLPQYEEVVGKIDSGAIKIRSGNLPLKYARIACYVKAYRDEQDVLTVEFIVGGIGLPPRRTAYIYSSNGTIEKESRADKKWHRIERVNEHWFRVSG
jgi:hypothetical protein